MPETVLVNEILGDEPLHIIGDAGVAVIDGVGSTITVAEAEAVQPFAEPITV